MGEAEPKKILVDWLVKIKILKGQIEKLEKLNKLLLEKYCDSNPQL